MVALSRGDPNSTGLVLQASQQVIDGVDVGVNQLKALGVGFCCCWVGKFRTLLVYPSSGGTRPVAS